MANSISRPARGEYAEYYQRYLDKIPDAPDAVALLERQLADIRRLAGLSAGQAASRYAPGKWSVRQVVGHVSDTERIFAYRLLRALRGDQTPLQGFDENRYVDTANFDDRTMADLAGELAAVRTATLALLTSLDPARLEATTVANGATVSVRALAFIIAAHTAHHFQLLSERYGVQV